MFRGDQRRPLLLSISRDPNVGTTITFGRSEQSWASAILTRLRSILQTHGSRRSGTINMRAYFQALGTVKIQQPQYRLRRTHTIFYSNRDLIITILALRYMILSQKEGHVQRLQKMCREMAASISQWSCCHSFFVFASSRLWIKCLSIDG
jgi:hypothetical protein